jgi:hypothetical protein
MHVGRLPAGLEDRERLVKPLYVTLVGLSDRDVETIKPTRNLDVEA